MDNQGCGELGDTVLEKEGAGIADGNASVQVHCICDGLLGEGGVRGESVDRDPVNQEGVRSWGEAEGFVGVIFGGNVLLGAFRQQIIVRGVVTSGVALGGGNGYGSIVLDGCHNMAASRGSSFPGRKLARAAGSVCRRVRTFRIF